jgi:hypothetical protein
MPVHSVVVTLDRQQRWRLECPLLASVSRVDRAQDVPAAAHDLVRARLGRSAGRVDVLLLVQGDDPRTQAVVDDLAALWSRDVVTVRLRPRHELPAPGGATVVALPVRPVVEPIRSASSVEQAFRGALLAQRRAELRADVEAEELHDLRVRATTLRDQLGRRRRITAQRAVERQLVADERERAEAQRFARVTELRPGLAVVAD